MSKAVVASPITGSVAAIRSTQNRLSGLDNSQIFDPETLAALNQWVGVRSVRVTNYVHRKSKSKVGVDVELDRTTNYICGSKKPDDAEPIIVN